MQVVVIGNTVIREGEWLSLNGNTGEVISGKQPLSPPALSGDLETFMSWADSFRRLKVPLFSCSMVFICTTNPYWVSLKMGVNAQQVMANADTPEDALTARNNGAQGIGLCRTEHMVSISSHCYLL